MDIASQVNIYFFPVMMLVIMWFDTRREDSDDHSSRRFRSVLACSCIAMLLEAFMWFINGRSGTIPVSVLVTNTAYLLVASASSLFWLAYLYPQLFSGRSLFANRAVAALLLVPYFLIAALIIANCFTGLIFSVDDAATYHRGPLFFVPYITMMGYIIAGSALSLAACLREGTREGRVRYARLAAFMLLPIVGAAVQMAFYGWWVMWPCGCISLLFVYLTVQNRNITNDALTDLNNRRSFDRRLQAYLGRPKSEGPWCLIMIDVDGLKAVNDTYGHAMGDEALCRMGDAMRAAFGGTDAFLARYGGDEFAVLDDCPDEEAARTLVRRLDDVVRRGNETAHGPFSLRYSAGWALCDPADGRDATELIACADAEMYKNKQAHRSGLASRAPNAAAAASVAPDAPVDASGAPAASAADRASECGTDAEGVE